MTNLPKALARALEKAPDSLYKDREYGKWYSSRRREEAIDVDQFLKEANTNGFTNSYGKYAAYDAVATYIISAVLRDADSNVFAVAGARTGYFMSDVLRCKCG